MGFAPIPIGGPEGIRTPDLFIANEARYQLRHRPGTPPHYHGVSDATAVDIRIADGVITAVEPAAPQAPSAGAGHTGLEIDGRGMLALPGLVNAHAHVDKSWWGLPWQSYGGEGGTDGRIRHERARRDELGIPSVSTTAHVLEQFVRHGTTAIRTHVDVDLGVAQRGIDAVREAVAAYDG
ncbi:MAG: cytosine deaminase, partial [Microbacterium sp.]|nr:cytosine deaminase [Microbacterium sp.]